MKTECQVFIQFIANTVAQPNIEALRIAMLPLIGQISTSYR